MTLAHVLCKQDWLHCCRLRFDNKADSPVGPGTAASQMAPVLESVARTATAPVCVESMQPGNVAVDGRNMVHHYTNLSYPKKDVNVSEPTCAVAAVRCSRYAAPSECRCLSALVRHSQQ